MSDLMTGSSGYAIGAIDTTAVLINGVSSRAAEHINGPAAAIVQIEQTLGSALTLKGTQLDLSARLSIALNATGTHKLDGFVGLTTDRGLVAVNSTTLQVMNHTPIGMIADYAGSSAPVNWLLNDGSAVSRATYAKLFAVIGTTYGVGDGSTTFNVPDIRGRVKVMVDGTANRITAASTNGVNADTLGGVGGTETHTLTLPESPSHTHTSNVGAGGGAGQPTIITTYSADDAAQNAMITSSAGGGGAHSNTQPWIAVNTIIFTGV